MGDPCDLPLYSASCFMSHVGGLPIFLGLGLKSRTSLAVRRQVLPPLSPIQRERQEGDGSPQCRGRKTEAWPLISTRKDQPRSPRRLAMEVRSLAPSFPHLQGCQGWVSLGTSPHLNGVVMPLQYPKLWALSQLPYLASELLPLQPQPCAILAGRNKMQMGAGLRPFGSRVPVGPAHPAATSRRALSLPFDDCPSPWTQEPWDTGSCAWPTSPALLPLASEKALRTA